MTIVLKEGTITIKSGTTKKSLLVVILIVLLSFSVWYKQPLQVERSYSASTLDGTTVHVTIHMNSYRNLLSPTKFKGRFIVNGDAYRTVETKEVDNLLERLNNKIRGIKKYPFIISEEQNGIYINQELVIISWDADNFNELRFALISKYDGIFYAPAANSSEAEEINNRATKELLD